MDLESSLGCRLRVDLERKFITILVDNKQLLVDTYKDTLILSTVSKVGNNIQMELINMDNNKI